MLVNAYIRVSTDAQDVANQRHGVSEYAKARGFAANYIEDTASGRKNWQERELGHILRAMVAGDVLLVAEVSRLARSTLQVLEILQFAAERGIAVHIVKNGMIMDGSLASRITATVLGLAAEIEREFISARTKEALAYRKAQGQKLGRPVGRKNNRHKIGKAEAREIKKRLKAGESKTAIAKALGIARNTLYLYLNANQLL